MNISTLRGGGLVATAVLLALASADVCRAQFGVRGGAQIGGIGSSLQRWNGGSGFGFGQQPALPLQQVRPIQAWNPWVIRPPAGNFSTVVVTPPLVYDAPPYYVYPPSRWNQSGWDGTYRTIPQPTPYGDYSLTPAAGTANQAVATPPQASGPQVRVVDVDPNAAGADASAGLQPNAQPAPIEPAGPRVVEYNAATGQYQEWTPQRWEEDEESGVKWTPGIEENVIPQGGFDDNATEGFSRWDDQNR